MSRTARHVVSLALLVAATALVGLLLDLGRGRTTASEAPSSPSSSPAPTSSSRSTVPPLPPVPRGAALDAVGLLATAEPAGGEGDADYDRAAFGPSWLDTDRNGCDTRNDVLRRDLTRVALKPGTRGCLVLSGTLVDPYTGQVVPFVRGAATSQLVQVDHVVALADAWRSGAASWAPARREAFANDPLELLAVDGGVNQAKGDAAAAAWLPPAASAHCPYAARQVAVKLAWGLRVTAGEAGALRSVLGACPQEQLPLRSPFVLGS